MSKIYTHTGDKGQTSLIGGLRVSKTHERIEAYGTIDELSSHLGLLVAMMQGDDNQRHRDFVTGVQQTLMLVSTHLATEPESSYKPKPLVDDLVTQMEREIDDLQSQLPPLKCFILPGGTPAQAQAHVCRTVCRRAERRILTLAENHPVEDVLLQYVNRLSDYLFVLSRSCK